MQEDVPPGFDLDRVAQETAKALPANWLFDQQMSVYFNVLASLKMTSLDICQKTVIETALALKMQRITGRAIFLFFSFD